jgi:hypothetical protein
MIARSTLRVRETPHIDRDRQGDTIIEVIRDGETVAMIYGSREGIHLVSDTLKDPRNLPFMLEVHDTPPGIVIPLLRPTETCPWCSDYGFMGPGLVCQLCGGRKADK